MERLGICGGIVQACRRVFRTRKGVGRRKSGSRSKAAETRERLVAARGSVRGPGRGPGRWIRQPRRQIQILYGSCVGRGGDAPVWPQMPPDRRPCARAGSASRGGRPPGSRPRPWAHPRGGCARRRARAGVRRRPCTSRSSGLAATVRGAASAGAPWAPCPSLRCPWSRARCSCRRNGRCDGNAQTPHPEPENTTPPPPCRTRAPAPAPVE